MPTIVGVRFRRAGKVYYFDPAGRDLQVDDWVVVDTARGLEVGQVAIAPCQVAESELKGLLKSVVRRATATDLRSLQAYRLRETDALARAREEAARHGLPIKIVGAEYNFDGSRLTFHFTADGRVDFRNLVRDLARILRTRIEMHQAGVRDEAKLMDGIGICGRRLCCAAFLDRFSAVSIRMAKLQNLPLNPTKISGQCGRLLCCLGYEAEFYREAKKRLPKPGEEVETIHGVGRVRGVNVISERITVEYARGKVQDISPDQLGPPEEPLITAKPPSKPAEPRRKKRRRRRRKPRPTASTPPTQGAPPTAREGDAARAQNQEKKQGGKTGPRPARRRRRPRKRSDKKTS